MGHRQGAPGTDSAAAHVWSGVAIIGGQAEQRDYLAAANRAKLRHVGAQAGSGERTAAGDRPDDVGAAGEEAALSAGDRARLDRLLGGDDAP